jgi:hypothetical protein
VFTVSAPSDRQTVTDDTIYNPLLRIHLGAAGGCKKMSAYTAETTNRSNSCMKDELDGGSMHVVLHVQIM